MNKEGICVICEKSLSGHSRDALRACLGELNAKEVDEGARQRLRMKATVEKKESKA